MSDCSDSGTVWSAATLPLDINEWLQVQDRGPVQHIDAFHQDHAALFFENLDDGHPQGVGTHGGTDTENPALALSMGRLLRQMLRVNGELRWK